jgi:hypothetical protein
MDKNAIIKAMGFEKCDWGPESEDTCEICERQGVQLYFQGNDYGEGTYACADCIVAIYEEGERDHKRVKALEEAGHHLNCAAGQVYDDEKCVCGKERSYSLTLRPGPGWRQLKGPVWEHKTGIRIHVSGLILRDANGEARDMERAYASLLYRLIKINGGNRKRGLMAFALNF